MEVSINKYSRYRRKIEIEWCHELKYHLSEDNMFDDLGVVIMRRKKITDSSSLQLYSSLFSS